MAFGPAHLVHTEDAALAESTASPDGLGSLGPGMRSSVGEHHVHTVGVAGSKPAASTSHKRGNGATRHDAFRYVYFVQAEALGLVKIGAAADAAVRFRSMHTDSPDKLNLLGVIRCDEAGDLERKLHVKFRADRAHREWFRPSQRLMTYIAKHASPIEKAVVVEIEAVIWGLRQKRQRSEGAYDAWIASQTIEP